MDKTLSNERTTLNLVAVIFAIGLPTLVTLIYFKWLSGYEPSVQQSAYGIGKGIQFALPVVWVWLFFRFRFQRNQNEAAAQETRSSSQIPNWLWAVGFGVKVCLVMAVALWVHSFLEEYYWRWFVYDLLKRFVNVPIANLISSLGFMAHHVVLLSVYFGWTSPMTWLCSAGVAIGGAYWAWLYQKTGTLVWPWVSHMVVDAGIFIVGYFLVKPLFVA